MSRAKERIPLWCTACRDCVSGWGAEDWRACPKCHRRGTLLTAPPPAETRHPDAGAFSGSSEEPQK
jgi:hypothetical protein